MIVDCYLQLYLFPKMCMIEPYIVKQNMTNESAYFVVLMKTGKRYELDMATNALTDANIPFYTQEEFSSGLRVAMPIATAMGPGIWWAILVPKAFLQRSKEVIEELPFEMKTNPDIWDFSPTKNIKRGWIIYAIIALLISLVVLIYEAINWLK